LDEEQRFSMMGPHIGAIPSNTPMFSIMSDLLQPEMFVFSPQGDIATLTTDSSRYQRHTVTLGREKRHPLATRINFRDSGQRQVGIICNNPER